MELILAKQSVHIKCRLQASILMGNYEYYYAGGLLCRLAKPLLDTYQPQNDQESYLMQMLKTYKVSDEYDEQMPQLLQMGLMDQ